MGKKVCVISHPDEQFYTFTQGQISRYTLQYDDPKSPAVKYMCITADYARGSVPGQQRLTLSPRCRDMREPLHGAERQQCVVAHRFEGAVGSGVGVCHMQY